MKVEYNVSTKPLSDTVPGELVRLAVPSANGKMVAATCLVLEIAKSATIGCLHAIEEQSAVPFHFGYRTDASCLSFGTDWLLVPKIDDGTYSTNRELLSKAGALHLLGSDWFVHFAPPSSDGLADAFDFNLTSNVIIDRSLSRNAAPFWEWQIFSSRDRYYAFPDDPIVTVRAV